MLHSTHRRRIDVAGNADAANDDDDEEDEPDIDQGEEEAPRCEEWD